MAAPSQFRSNYKAMIVVARHGHDILHPVTGTKIDEVKALRAEFGVHSGEYNVIDPLTGKESTFADIRGFFYDLDVDAAAKGWSDDEKEAMRLRLVKMAVSNPDMVQIHSIPAAPLPFPTYDEVPLDKIAQLCIDLGFTAEALAFERENRNDEDVVKVLEAELKASQAVPVESVEELTAA